MFCPMCGAPNDENADYCGNCGAALKADLPPQEPAAVEEPVETPDVPAERLGLPEEPAIPPPPPAPFSPPPLPPRPVAASISSSAPVSGMAVASLVLGIAGLSVLPLISSVFAVILGYMARRDIRQRPTEASGDGIALAGIILGWIGIALLVLGILGVAGVMLCGLCSYTGTGTG